MPVFTVMLARRVLWHIQAPTGEIAERYAGAALPGLHLPRDSGEWVAEAIGLAARGTAADVTINADLEVVE